MHASACHRPNPSDRLEEAGTFGVMVHIVQHFIAGFPSLPQPYQWGGTLRPSRTRLGLVIDVQSRPVCLLCFNGLKLLPILTALLLICL